MSYTREELVDELVAQGRTKYTTYHTDLWLSQITPEYRLQTCGYWYLITQNATSHTAFATKKGFLRWLNERNLTLTAPLTAEGVPSSQKIEGGYFRSTWLDVKAFALLEQLTPECDKTKVMDNGYYTLGLLTRDVNGIVTVNLLNPNCERIVFPYKEAALEMR